MKASNILLLLLFTKYLSAQSMGIKTSSPNTSLDVNGGVSFREGTALALANGVNSDVALADYSLFRITGPTAIFSITGFANGADGRVLTIINATNYAMTLTHQATSSAANQINAGGTNITIAANGVATLIYNTTLTKWVVTGTLGASVTTAWALTGNSGTTAGTSFVGTTDAQSVVFKANNTEGMRMLTSGNLGLGLTVPAVKLHQDNGNATATYHKFTAGTTTGQTSGDGFDIGVDASGNAIIEQNEALPMIFNTSATERMRILSGGNIGLGLTSPSVKLHQDNGNATATYHKFTAGTTTGQTSGDGFDIGVDASGNAIIEQNEALPMIFNTSATERMRILSTGDILIGALTPGEVTGVAVVNQSASDQKDDVTITTYNTTTTPAFVLFKARGTAASPATLTNSELIGGFNANGYTASGFSGLTAITSITASDYTTSFGADISFRTTRSGSSTERLRILSTGNVGIGVAAPSHILQINGQGRATSSSWATSSDRRLKDIDGAFNYGLKELLAIHTVRFHYKKDNPLNLPTDKAFQGVIAQELQQVIPEAVQTNPDGFLTVSTDPVFWTMSNAIKDLNTENEKLKVELEQTKAALHKQTALTDVILFRLETLEAALTTKPTPPKESYIKTEKR